MENQTATGKKWPMWAAIAALVLSILSLCGGWFIPYCSLACPLFAVILAAVSLKAKRGKLSLAALGLSILSLLALASLGTLLWLHSSSTAEGVQFGQSVGGLSRRAGQPLPEPHDLDQEYASNSLTDPAFTGEKIFHV